jgi:hypothetical protein
MENHFRAEDWVDFARGCAKSEDGERMQQHLDAGCRPCSETAALWTRVARTAWREPDFEPPAGDLRCATALYGLFTRREPRGFKIALARLIGFNQPALEGIRGAGSASHFLYRQRDVLFDLHLESRGASGNVSLVGQVLDTASGKRYANRPVSVMRDRHALAQTTTNEFGEFQLQFTRENDLLIVVELENQSYLVSPLPADTN